jgi:hypothetical protein
LTYSSDEASVSSFDEEKDATSRLVILKLFLELVNLPLELELLNLGRELLHTRILRSFIHEGGLST